MLFTIINFAGFWGVVSEKKIFFCYLVVSLPFLCHLSLSLSLSSLTLQRSKGQPISLGYRLHWKDATVSKFPPGLIQGVFMSGTWFAWRICPM